MGTAQDVVMDMSMSQAATNRLEAELAAAQEAAASEHIDALYRSERATQSKEQEAKMADLLECLEKCGIKKKDN